MECQCSVDKEMAAGKSLKYEGILSWEIYNKKKSG